MTKKGDIFNNLSSNPCNKKGDFFAKIRPKKIDRVRLKFYLKKLLFLKNDDALIEYFE